MTETTLQALPKLDLGSIEVQPGTLPELRLVPLADLVVDDAYQRSASGDKSRRRIQKIAAKFNWRSFGAIVVARIGDGRYAVLDGQHRATAAMALGQVVEVPAVIIDADQVGQAQAFTDINSTRAGLDKAQRFHAAVAAEDPEACEIQAMLDTLGIQVQRNPHPDGIKPLHTRAISALAKLIKKPGKEFLADALEMIAEAWPEEHDQFGGAQIQAVTLVTKAVYDAAEDMEERDSYQARLSGLIAKTDLRALRDQAAAYRNNIGGGAIYLVMADLLMRDFNKGLRGKITTRFAI